MRDGKVSQLYATDQGLHRTDRAYRLPLRHRRAPSTTQAPTQQPVINDS